MGIPVGWNIVRDEAKEKDVLRADVTGSRSPIRRRARGSRPPRNHALSAFDTDALVDGPTSRFANVLEHAPRLSHARTQLPPAPPVPELQERDLDRDELRPRSLSIGDGSADGERPLPALTPGFAPAGPRSSRYGEAVDRARRADQRAQRRAEHGTAAEESDALREPSDWTSLSNGATSWPTGARPRRLPPGDSPPRPASGRRIELDDFVEGAPPPFASRILTWTSRRRHAPYARGARNTTTFERMGSPSDDETPSTIIAVSHPPLRRVGHRRIADGPLPASSLRESWSPVSTLDGLGDRERSNSVSSTSSNLPWQTFLSTVVPDPVAPTAESSFASAAASASFAASSSRASSSNSNSARSSNTALTVPSRRASPDARRARGEDMSESFARACESSDEGESTASDTEDEASANPLSRRRIRPSYFADEPPSPRRYGRSVMEQGSDARRYVRSYYSDAMTHGALYELGGSEGRSAHVDGPIDGSADEPVESFATTIADDDVAPSTSPASPLDQELRDARSLLERLSRRDDIGDDFWASVGLTRSFGDGVERVQERGRF